MTIKDMQATNEPINYEGLYSDANVSVNPFGQNRAAEIAYKKVERIVLATHLVTNFVPERECVRDTVRNKSQDLLPLVMELRGGLQSVGPHAVERVQAHVRQILSLLDIVHASGYISNMNLEVLKFAYADLVRFIEKSQEGSASESLELHEKELMSVTRDSHVSEISKGQKKSIKDTSVKDIQKDIKVIKDIQQSEDTRAQSLRTKRRLKSRRMAILDVVTKKSPIHIKDIAKEITDCSEKTIQRELSSLVNDNVLVKEGSKRWTTYSLAV